MYGTKRPVIEIDGEEAAPGGGGEVAELRRQAPRFSPPPRLSVS